MTEQTNTPELRFPEFRDKWSIYKLFEVLKSKTEGMKRGPFGGALKKEIFVEDGYAVYEQRNAIYDNQDFRYFIDENKYKEMILFSVLPGDIIMSCSGTIGRLSLIPNNYREGVINQALIRFRTNNAVFNNYFLIYMRSMYMQRKMLEINPGSAITNLIPVKELKLLDFPLPSLDEQKKISDFFSKLDQQIELEEKKLKLLEQQKHGYMQKIFSRELRLKDENGNLSPEWTQTQLKNITNRITRKNKKLESTRPLTISGQLGLIDQVEYFNKSVSSKNLENYTLLQKNEFAYNKSYSNGYPLGAIKRLTRYDKGVLSSLYICFSINSDISVDFMQYYFESTKWFREVASIAVEGARNHGLLNISVNNFFDINIKLPSLENQKKISSFLIKIDNLIEKQSSKVELLKQRKQGLLQKMFV